MQARVPHGEVDIAAVLSRARVQLEGLNGVRNAVVHCDQASPRTRWMGFPFTLDGDPGILSRVGEKKCAIAPWPREKTRVAGRSVL
jgi:hypothetical protein